VTVIGVEHKNIRSRLCIDPQHQFLLQYSRTPFIRIANYPDRFGPSGIFVVNSTKLTCLEITGYRIKYSTVLWLLELQDRRGRKGLDTGTYCK